MSSRRFLDLIPPDLSEQRPAKILVDQKQKNEDNFHDFFEIPPPKNFFSIKILFVNLLLFIIGSSIMFSGYLLYNKAHALKNNIAEAAILAQKDLESAQGLISENKIPEAQKKLDDANNNFEEAKKNLANAGQLQFYLNKLPYAKSDIVATQELISISQNLISASEDLSSLTTIFKGYSPFADSSQLTGNQLFQKIDETKNNVNLFSKRLSQYQKQLREIKSDSLQNSVSLLSQKIDKLQKIANFANAFLANADSVLGSSDERKFLIIFQNPAEARATGGFIGNYGILTIKDGQIKNIEVQDIYNLRWENQGRIDPVRVPDEMKQYMREVGNWEIQDANWFIDFPTSAKKIEWFYEYYNQGLVDGVITINPQVFEKILDIVGPIKMPAYKTTMTANNFWSTVQYKVEFDNPFKKGIVKNYGLANPKQILKDFSPMLLAMIKNLSTEQNSKLLKDIYACLEEKNIQLFFNNNSLQNLSSQLNFAGEVNKSSGDYLYVNTSNVRMTKTSKRIIQNIRMSSTVASDGSISDKVIINRYNSLIRSRFKARDVSYLRILAPLGSKLISAKIDGQDIINQVTVSAESGKTKFGILAKLDIGQKQQIELDYKLDQKLSTASYNVIIQKQSGRDSDTIGYELSLPQNFALKSPNSPDIIWGQRNLTLNSILSIDRILNLQILHS